MNRFLKLIFIIFIFGAESKAFSDQVPKSRKSHKTPSEKDLPPTWQVKSTKTKDETAPPDVPHRWHVGVDAGLPDLLTFEGIWRPFEKFGFGAFAGLPYPLKIKVEMPSDVISTSKGIGIAYPDYDINLTGTYGPNFGTGLFFFPFSGSFFIHAGVARRYLLLNGEAQSAVLICSIADVAKEPPCPDASATIRTRSELQIKARAETDAWTGRLAIGWLSQFGERWYLKTVLGVSQPFRVKNEVSSEVSIDTKSKELDQEVLDKLAKVKSDKEADLNDKAINEIDPYTRKTLPILTFALGVTF